MMTSIRRYYILNQLIKLAYSTGVIFLIAGILLSLISQPAFASTGEKGNPSGTSLAFTSGCEGECQMVTATVCNTGTEDMEDSVQWELYYSSTNANQREKVTGVGGSIQLDGKECTTLSAAPDRGPGQYWFKADQPEGHPGKGELFSNGCDIDLCSIPEALTPEVVITPSETPIIDLTDEPTTVPTEASQIRPYVEFTVGDTGICQYQPGDISATIVVTLPEGMSARLQAEFHLVKPITEPHNYIDAGIVKNGDTFTYSGEWPGIQPGDTVVEIHFGAALLDVDTGNPLGAFGSLDYFWYPYICSAPTPTPTEDPGDPGDPTPTPTPTEDPGDPNDPTPTPTPTEDPGDPGDPASTPTPTEDPGDPGDPTSTPTPTEDPGDPGGPTSTPTPTEDPGDPGDPTSTPTPTEDPGDPGDPASTPTPTKDPGDPGEPTPTPTQDPGDPKDPGDSAPSSSMDEFVASNYSAPNNPRSNEDVVLPPYAASAAEPVQLLPLDPPMAVASAVDIQVLIPVTGADMKSPAAGSLNNLLIYLGLMFIGVALMTQGVTRKFINL